MGESEVSSKSSKKSKANKKSKDEVTKEDNSVMDRKQEELMRVLNIKKFQLQNDNLSYLDYIELKEEILRLNALKDTFNSIDK